jgi:hypothetical protein
MAEHHEQNPEPARAVDVGASCLDRHG